MTDRSRSSLPGSPAHRSSRNPAETFPQNDPSGHPPDCGHVDIIALVRSLQRSAGVADCFRRGKVDCDDVQCNWRSYCLALRPSQGHPSEDLPE